MAIAEGLRRFQSGDRKHSSPSNWVNNDMVEVCTDVLTMAGLRNSLRTYDPTLVVGLVPVGDAYCHTDPVLAHGLSFGLIHAASLTAALHEHDDIGDACTLYAAETESAIRERYEFATHLDEQRLRMWMGEPVNFASADGDYALFTVAAAGAVSPLYPQIMRCFLRRMGLPDSTAVLDNDTDLQGRIASLFKVC